MVAHRVVTVRAGGHCTGDEGVRIIDEHLDPDCGAGQRSRVSQPLFAGSPRKNRAPSISRPTTLPRSQRRVAPRACSYQSAAAPADGTASMQLITVDMARRYRLRQDGGMISDEVLAWFAGCERSWRERDPDGVERLFTEDAHYRVSPYMQRPRSATPPSKRSGPRTKGRRSPPRRHRWRSTVIVRCFGSTWSISLHGIRSTATSGCSRSPPTGGVEDFEEWPYWPGKPYTAAGD